MVLTAEDTINGIPIQSWLNTHETKPEFTPNDIENKHSIYNRPTLKYPVKKGRSGKVRSLTRNEIIKIYGVKPMSHIKKVLKVISEMDPQKYYDINDIYVLVKKEIQRKSLSAVLATMFPALNNNGLLFKDGKPHKYSVQNELPSIDTMERLILDDVNKKSKARVKKKKENLKMKDVPDKIKKERGDTKENLQEQLMKHAEVNIPLNQLSGLINSLIKKQVGDKLKVQIDIRFGVIND